MDNDLDRSTVRVVGSEHERTKHFGFGATKQGSALVRQHLQQLAERIRADRVAGRGKPAWRALRGIDDEDLAVRLLTAGLSVCYGDKLGVDNEDQKNYRDIALFIGRQFGKRRDETALKVGEWGINTLLTLPIFALVDDDILYLPESLADYFDDVLARVVVTNPLLSPLTTSPVPWTGVRKGGLPADHWANVPLIREHHPSIERAVRKAIGDVQTPGIAIGASEINPLLDAINALQQVPFAINEPVLEFVKRFRPDVAPTDIVTAETLACCDHFYVPLNIDFRGRVYPIPHFSFEKPSELDLDRRVEWAEHNLPLLRQIGEAALRGDDPKEIAWALTMEEPCQFVAACVELVQAIDRPDFITRLPLTFDATCSGLQHLCAMTRSEEGRYVNILPPQPRATTCIGALLMASGAVSRNETTHSSTLSTIHSIARSLSAPS